jgi:hypothetical protein
MTHLQTAWIASDTLVELAPIASLSTSGALQTLQLWGAFEDASPLAVLTGIPRLEAHTVLTGAPVKVGVVVDLPPVLGFSAQPLDPQIVVFDGSNPPRAVLKDNTVTWQTTGTSDGVVSWGDQAPDNPNAWFEASFRQPVLPAN